MLRPPERRAAGRAGGGQAPQLREVLTYPFGWGQGIGPRGRSPFGSAAAAVMRTRIGTLRSTRQYDRVLGLGLGLADNAPTDGAEGSAGDLLRGPAERCIHTHVRAQGCTTGVADGLSYTRKRHATHMHKHTHTHTHTWSGVSTHCRSANRPVEVVYDATVIGFKNCPPPPPTHAQWIYLEAMASHC